MTSTTTPETNSPERAVDTGLASLVLIFRFHGIAVDPAQLTHKFGSVTFGVSEMLRSAKELELKARVIQSSWERLADTPLPAIAERKNGTFFILGKVSEGTVLIQDPLVGRPQILPRAEFEAQWSGNLVLMARRAGLGELARSFNITWFLQAMHKYRHLLYEVLFAHSSCNFLLWSRRCSFRSWWIKSLYIRV